MLIEDMLLPLLFGFLLGCFTIVMGVLVFWISETRRYNRRYTERSEHAASYERIGTRSPRA